MILFQSDWERENAFPDVNTSNKSFLRLAEVYKRMGVNNYYFHLALYDETLVGINPHSKDLTTDQMIRVAAECKKNFWYVIREVIRIPPNTGGDPIVFEANRGNIGLYWLFFNHIDVFNIQPRQTGKSVGTDCLMTILLFMMLENTTITLVTQDDELRKKNIESIKRIRDCLPPYLISKDRTDSNNKEEVSCSSLNNFYRTRVSQKSPAAAVKVGRGTTTAIKQMDEVPYIDYLDELMPAFLNSGNKVRQEARANGTPYGNIFTTTAGKKNTRSGAYAFNMLRGGMVFNENSLFDSDNEEHVVKIVEKNSPGVMKLVNLTMAYYQLGYTAEDVKRWIKETGTVGDAADRDYFNIWTSGSTRSPLSVAQLELISKSKMDPLYVSISREGYVFNWYIPEEDIKDRMDSGKFALGMDTSDAIGRDAITLTLVDTATLEVIGASVCNESNIMLYASHVADLMVRYKNIILIPERRSSWAAFVDTICSRLIVVKEDPFRRIYNVAVDNSVELVEEYAIAKMGVSTRPIAFYSKYKRLFGFATGSTGQHSRHVLYTDVLQTAATRGGYAVRDSRLVTEILELEIKDGRIDHSNSGHDDTVVSWLLCIWFLTYSKNLRFYGIDSPLSNVPEILSDKPPLTPYEKHQKESQAAYREEMEALVEKLKGCDDNIIIMKIESRLKAIDSKIDGEFIAGNSLDSLLEDIRKLRARNRAVSNRPTATRGSTLDRFGLTRRRQW